MGAGNTFTSPDLRLVETPLNDAVDNTLYTSMPKRLIADVKLTDAQITIRRSYDVTLASGKLTSNLSAETDETFLPFDEERYSLIRADGVTEELTSDKFEFLIGSTNLNFNNLSYSGSGIEATLVATLKKAKPKAKVKQLNLVNSVVVDKSIISASGTGSTTLNDGLTFGNYAYGTRVQDENISLNAPDVIKILGIFESTDTNAASAPKANLVSITGPTGKTSDLILGEMFRGATSGATAVTTEIITDGQISYTLVTDNNFKEGETVLFGESKVQAILRTRTSPSRNISGSFTFNNGQKGTFYDQGFISRKKEAKKPIKQLKVYFVSGYYESSDTGDVTTRNSYDSFSYTNQIQTVNGIRNTDLIDIRPRVENHTVAENTRSPLEFYGRTFGSTGNSAANILASDESITTDFTYYLGRIDRIFLTKAGRFKVSYGLPAEDPKRPLVIDDALEVATISLPPYLFNPSNASLSFLNHKRYKMSDIRQLEERIKNLEYYSSLSLLETNTSNLFIPDADGINRFKSGFFVDNFTSLLAQETSVEIKNSVDPANKEFRPRHYTSSIDLQVGPVVDNDDLQFGLPEGRNIRKSDGGIITLDYREVEWKRQSFGTRSESVTPYLVNFWTGVIELTPSTDVWVDTARIEAKIIEKEGNFAQSVALAQGIFGGYDEQTGFTPVLWQAWETSWTGTDSTSHSTNREERGESSFRSEAKVLVVVEE